MRVLVTGAAGFIGSHLAERLAGLGHAVSGVDCLTDTYARDFKWLNLLHMQECGVAHLPLDFNPSVPLEAALAKEIEWYERPIHGKVSVW